MESAQQLREVPKQKKDIGRAFDIVTILRSLSHPLYMQSRLKPRVTLHVERVAPGIERLNLDTDCRSRCPSPPSPRGATTASYSPSFPPARLTQQAAAGVDVALLTLSIREHENEHVTHLQRPGCGIPSHEHSKGPRGTCRTGLRGYNERADGAPAISYLRRHGAGNSRAGDFGQGGRGSTADEGKRSDALIEIEDQQPQHASAGSRLWNTRLSAVESVAPVP